MKIHNRRQREALYTGIADVPLPEPEEIMDRFDLERTNKTHTTMMRLLYDLQRIRRKPTRRPLPGILLVA